MLIYNKQKSAYYSNNKMSFQCWFLKTPPRIMLSDSLTLIDNNV